MVGKSSFDLLLSWINWLISLLDRYVERTASCEQSADSAASLTRFPWLNAGQDPPAFTKASLRSSTVAYVPPSTGGAVTVTVTVGVGVAMGVDAEVESPQPVRTNAPAARMAAAIPRFFNFQFPYSRESPHSKDTTTPFYWTAGRDVQTITSAHACMVYGDTLRPKKCRVVDNG